MRVLDFVPLILKQEALLLDPKFLPRQQGGRGGAAHLSPSPAKNADRKRKPPSSPPGQVCNKPAGVEVGEGVAAD